MTVKAIHVVGGTLHDFVTVSTPRKKDGSPWSSAEPPMPFCQHRKWQGTEN